MFVALTVALVATVTPFWLLGTGDNPVSADSVGQTSTAPQPVVPGAGAAYLGAFVDPNGTALTSGDPTGGTASLRAELRSLRDFNEQAGRTPAILSTFQDWGQPVDVAELDSAAATGAVPMVTWNCGDTDANVVAGLDDARVSAQARDLAAADVPVLFRWFPDANLPGVPAAASCLGTGGASGYIAAYQHIHSLFEAADATNVAFVWSVDTSAAADPNFARYYPGGEVVDWIAADGGATASDGTQPSAFSSAFGSWYSAFSTAGKPMMVSSTGADPGSQPAYLGQILSDLPGQYPQIRALVYFDAPQAASGDQPQLDAAGSASFRQLAASPYFNPKRSQTVTTVSSAQASVPIGGSLTVNASVTATDNSGSVSFLDNGSVIEGCVFIPITTPARCQTSRLGAGPQSIVAVYSGDTAFSPSTSAPVTVTVDAASTPMMTPGTPSSSATRTPSGSIASRVPAGPPLAPSGPQVPPPGSAFLGSFVDPSGGSLQRKNPTGGIASLSSELVSLPAVQQTLARPLSIIPVYLNWTDPLTVTELDQVEATGGIPLITWNCGDTNRNVAAGLDDSQISLVAAKLAQFKLPVFLRWFPDPNLESSPANGCLGSGGAAAYVAAYQHIHAELAAAGASNVSYVWSVDTTSPHRDPSWSTYYPGAPYVDWIGADGYANSSTTGTVARNFGSWYAEFSADKPLMISQTAAIPSLQAQYIGQLATVPTQFPQIRAVVYFDAPDVAAGNNYELPSFSAGAQQLVALSELPSFQPTRTATTSSVTASANPVSQGQVVHLSAQVGNADLGGHLTFSDNGSSLPGCGAVPLDPASSCDMSTLPVGTNQIVVDYSGDAVSGASTSSGLDLVVTSTGHAIGPPAIPASGQAYLGAWVRPQVSHSILPLPAAVLEELQNLPYFNAGLARPLSIVHLYQTWKNPASTGPIQRVLAQGAIPMIDWRCGDTDANIIAGNDDALISAEAQQLAALRAPVFLRWYYEPNFPNSPNYSACISSLGPAGYVAAFRHIHDLFAAAGASNVGFVFCLATAGNTDQDVYDYYPGSSYVDWIAADGYVRKPVPAPTAFVDRFGSWYSAFAALGKPMMVSETASWAGGQVAYLQQIGNQLSRAGNFPLIKAVMYFDAPGNEGQNTYPLDSPGMRMFQNVSASPMFQPSRIASSVAASASPAMVGHRVKLDAQVSNTDFGGAVSFFVNDTPVSGCQSIPLAATSSCTTTSLPVGISHISVVYSGDAEVTGSTATTVGKVRSSPSGAVSPGSGPPVSQSEFAPFLGVPDLGGMASLGSHGRNAALFAFPLTLSLPNFATPSHAGGGSNSDPIGWIKNALHGGGVGSVLLPVGGFILFLLVTYMVCTWTEDRRRAARAAIASIAQESHGPARRSGPLKPEEPETLP